MNTLVTRLSLALLLILVATGAAFFTAERINTRLYYEELTQRLNAPIAMYVTEQQQLIRDGAPNRDALQALAGHAMVINPTAEIYLLDTAGRILAHGLQPDAVLRERVDLEPIVRLLEGKAPMPIHGDDPGSAGSTKVFSAAEVRDGDRLAGYLYVVLGGKTFDALANDLGASYVGRTSAISALLIVLAAVVIGFLIFELLTRRLKRLTRSVQRAADTGYQELPDVSFEVGGGDEIDRLGESFAAMSATIRLQIEQLRENDRLRRELISNVSHDLRTPLSAMQGYIETLILKGESLSGDERDRYLRIARRHTVRLGTLIGDLFELSRLDSASVVPNVEVFSLSELLQDVAQEFQLDAEKKDITLSIETNTETGRTRGDIGLIQRVLENLVRNAIRFTPAGGEITLRIAERPASLAVAVSDNGSGISPDELPRIFDRFYRSEEGSEALSQSSGLGLAIVKRILDLHESRISVISAPNEGTTFEFELPLLRQAA